MRLQASAFNVSYSGFSISELVSCLSLEDLKSGGLHLVLAAAVLLAPEPHHVTFQVLRAYAKFIGV